MKDLNHFQPQKKYKILLIGDSCIDEYVYGTVDRISPEAPVPVLRIEQKTTAPGMAANVKLNLENLDCQVDFVTNPETITKTRFVDSRYNHHLIRVDYEKPCRQWSGKTEKDYSQYDAMVVSDYAKGFLTYGSIENLRVSYQGPIFMDTKKPDLSRFEGCFVKINELEYGRKTSECSDMIVTLGSQGTRYQDQIFPAPRVEVFDVCGAGDTFLAALTYGYLTLQDLRSAIEFANKAAAITVTHFGNYAPTREEIV